MIARTGNTLLGFIRIGVQWVFIKVERTTFLADRMSDLIWRGGGLADERALCQGGHPIGDRRNSVCLNSKSMREKKREGGKGNTQW